MAGRSAGAIPTFTRRESASTIVTNTDAFNALYQIANQQVSRNGTTLQNLTCTFSATQNNGQILSQGNTPCVRLAHRTAH